MKFQVLRIAALTTLAPCEGSYAAQKASHAEDGGPRQPFTIEFDEPV